MAACSLKPAVNPCNDPPHLPVKEEKVMARSVLRSIILLFMLGSGVMCQPEQVTLPALKGKLVLNRACSNFVIQVLQGSVDPSKIDPLWKDTANDSTYINVFAVANRCTFPSGLAEGDTIFFALDPNPPAQTCQICQIYYPTPPVMNAVQDVQKIN
jgi:hypothetical protein